MAYGSDGEQAVAIGQEKQVMTHHENHRELLNRSL